MKKAPIVNFVKHVFGCPSQISKIEIGKINRPAVNDPKRSRKWTPDEIGANLMFTGEGLYNSNQFSSIAMSVEEMEVLVKVLMNTIGNIKKKEREENVK